MIAILTTINFKNLGINCLVTVKELREGSHQCKSLKIVNFFLRFLEHLKARNLSFLSNSCLAITQTHFENFSKRWLLRKGDFDIISFMASSNSEAESVTS